MDNVIRRGVRQFRPLRAAGIGLNGNLSAYDGRQFQRDLKDVTESWEELKRVMETRGLSFPRQARDHATEIHERLLRMIPYLETEF